MEKLWSVLLHFGTNMWNEIGNTKGREKNLDAVGSDTLRFDKPLFRDLVEKGIKNGMNALILDLGEGLRYESHPELAVNGSWSRAEMEKELEYLRELGIEIIPKLNFSTGHNHWLGDYSRMVSTPAYYRVVEDLIHEVCEIFKPKYFHIGMDEETAANQTLYHICVVRQHDLWWHDLYHLINTVEKENVRAWMWSDYMWDHKEFVEKCPKEVIQSNWYYGLDPKVFYAGAPELEARRTMELQSYDLLDKHGFIQVPTASNWSTAENMDFTVKYAKEHISNDKLLGFMQAPWYMTIEANRQRLTDSLDQLGEAKKWFDKQ